MDQARLHQETYGPQITIFKEGYPNFWKNPKIPGICERGNG